MRGSSVFPAMVIAVSATVSVGFASVTPKVIYGDDNRRDLYQVTDPNLREIASSTVAIIPRTNLVKQSGGFKLVVDSFGKEMNLCKEEPYYEQPAAANCSGALVGEDLVATAGHCVTDQDCKNYYFVFDYKMRSSVALPSLMSDDDVYTCKEIVARELTREQDYALVRLDRPARGHRPLTMSTAGVVPGEELFVVGHPSGLPTKYADGATVRSLANGFFVADLDTYGGNSGSAVFSARSNQIVGILVRGAQDFRYDNINKCTRSNICVQDGCRGEDVTDISYVTRALAK